MMMERLAFDTLKMSYQYTYIDQNRKKNEKKYAVPVDI
jgi:hypothetical protein